MKLEQEMKSLRLSGMSRMWQAMQETRRHHELTLSEGLEVLLQAETQDRENRRFERLKMRLTFAIKPLWKSYLPIPTEVRTKT